MATLAPPLSTVEVTVRRPMNAHGAMTVTVAGTNETRHLVEYASPRVRAALSDLPDGTTIPLDLRRVGERSNVWRVESLHSSSPPEAETTRESDR